MKQPIRGVLLTALALGLSLGLTACGGRESALIGSWTQVGTSSINPEVQLRDIRITYDSDGTSDYSATMLMGAAGAEPQRFDLVADVAWTLEETVITRTLKSIEATPASSATEAQDMARSIEQAYMQTPPVNLIIQTLDDEQLVLLDPETRQTQTYRRD